MHSRKKPLTPLGKYIIKALTDRDMTKTELAYTVGISQPYLTYILNGTRSGRKYIPNIIQVLELDPDQVERMIA